MSSRPPAGAAARRVALVLAGFSLGGCAPLPPDTPDTAADAEAGRARAPAFVVMQRARRGSRLVLIDETGARLGELTELGPVPVRDNSPTLSPDRRWVVFASSRGRADMRATSLWIIELRRGAQPRRLTTGDHDDRDPAWLPDGRSLVFASDRGGSFDLWRLDLRPGPGDILIAAGLPQALTARPRQALHPAPSPDGERILYTEADLDGGGSELWQWQGGEVAQVTDGPADATPAWSPDGRTIAFSGRIERADGTIDSEIFVMDAGGRERRLVVEEPLAAQSHPVWSADGRYLFSTSLLRSVADGKPILSSVTFVDLREQPPLLRALHDPVVVESRASPVMARETLDAARLHENPSYRDALAEAATRARMQRPDEP
ncbi:TolB family protein [Haliangium sp.]|uniref:TolB family protein n=1 Tax=Haliangium sp. TaxID=2663208 RepID=UPI003D1319A5